MNERLVFVNKANQLENPIDMLPSFKEFNKNDLKLTISTVRGSSLDADEKDALFSLLEDNMKTMYEQSEWGWNEKHKREEMFDEAAWYLLASDETGRMQAFSHFRFDMDCDDEVLYVYEIQTRSQIRRKGLGKFMMRTLELLAFKAEMRKIMLTVFKHNPSAVAFFQGALGFAVDETSPEDDVYEQFDYQILSRFNRRKLAEEEKKEDENNAAVANAV